MSREMIQLSEEVIKVQIKERVLGNVKETPNRHLEEVKLISFAQQKKLKL